MSTGSSIGDYVCALDQPSIQKAKDELGENPADRIAAVQALRDWIDSQPHIKFGKTDAVFLLKFLRWAKFSQLRAREIIERNLNLKNIEPKWYSNIDTHDSQMKELINSGFTVTLPKRTPDGCLVILHRWSCLNKLDMDPTSMWCKLCTVIVNYITKSEMTQVNGLVYIMDLTAVETKLLTKLLNPKMAKWNKLWQKNIPVRFKNFHFYNAGGLLEMLMAFIKPFLSSKFINRIHIHDTAESLYKNIPLEMLPVEYLPDDYTGPNAGNLEKLTENLKAELLDESFRKELFYVTGPDFAIDESKRPAVVAEQHFRKLNID